MKIVATTSLQAVYRPNDAAQTTTTWMPHARANYFIAIAEVAVYCQEEQVKYLHLLEDVVCMSNHT